MARLGGAPAGTTERLQLGAYARRVHTGSTQRGLQVGDPISLARALYGEPTEQTGEAWIYSNGVQRLEIQVSHDKTGVGRAASFRLTNEP